MLAVALQFASILMGSILLGAEFGWEVGMGVFLLATALSP